MEPSKEAIAVRITRLNRQILGKVTSGSHKLNKKTIDREALLDALTVLYDECNDDPVKKTDELVRAFVDKYRSTLAELRRTRVCLSDFEILQTIGRGHFGEVHMVREKETGDVYALKTLRKEQARKRAAGAAEDERDVLANATGPWMPRLQYAFQDSNSLYLVMELCSGGDLAGLLARRARPLAESDAAFYVAEVAHALKALHAMGYVHRDIKPHNIFLDRCGHVKLGDFGSCARLSEGGAASAAGGTPDYVAPELLAAADCAARHAVCLPYCRSVVTNAISACDYWSLGVVAFELVTLKRPFSNGEDDSIPEILANIQKYESSPDAEPPFEAAPAGPSRPWRALVAGLLRVAPARRYNYLDTLQHPALAGASGRMHSIRDLAPPWVPMLRGAEDSSYLGAPEREPPPPCAAPFRARHPFAGQLPFIGYSYVAPEENEDSSGGFNASHDCTAIDLATFKSAEKLAAMRGREVSSLQSKLAASEAAVGAAAERARREADAEAERTRARLQAEITALSLQNRRLERQVEVEKEERMALQRTNQELTSGAADRASSEVRAARAHASSVEAERDALRDDLRRLEARVGEVQAECARAVAAADAARAQHQHYKDIIEHVHELRHRRLTEMNVRAVDSVAKERALRRQTLSGCENESRELTTRAAAAEANAAREARARTHAERRFADLEDEHGALTAEHAAVRAELDEARAELKTIKASAEDQQHALELATEQMKQAQQQLAQERVRNSSLTAQVQELQRGLEEAARRETALEEQSTRTEARLNERLHTADARLTAALADEARHREKVNTLEQLVRQLEREVGALESRGCVSCAARAEETTDPADRNRGDSASDRGRGDSASDTESVADAAHAQLALLKEQLERAEGQLQSRAEEIATLRQEARSANLARWRKEREYNDLSVEAKSNARDLKRLEERLSHAVEARKTAEQKANALQEEVVVLKPKYEQANATVETLSGQLERLRKAYETAQAEVDRSRNDIRKLKSELQYSEKRRLHAEQQEEMSSRELQALRVQNTDLVQNNKALQEACGLLEEQLTDLEKLADIHEIKNKDLESETQRLRTELETCRGRLVEAEKQASERGAAASIAAQHHDEARETARHAHCQLQLLRERLENREARVAELESRVASLEGSASGTEAALGAALRRVRELQEESSALRTRAHEHHAHALALQAGLADAQEELSAAREAAEAAAAWWRTRETKADATLRQQAKLIDFLQAKVEEAGRKKCSLSNKLFGRSGRRSAASPPLRRVNRELREEVERLRAQLASRNGEPEYPPTPRREKPKAAVASRKSIDMPDGSQDNNSVQIIWSDGVRERVRARMSEAGEVLLSVGDATMRARLLAPDAHNLPQNEANRAFAIKLECPARCDRAAVVCSSIEERNSWLQRLRAAAAAAAPAGYAPHSLGLLEAEPAAALYVAPNAVAIGCEDGLHSLRGPIRLELEGECDVSPARVTGLAAGAGRALIIRGGMLLHVSLLTLGSALRRSSNLKPTVTVARVQLQDDAPPHLIRPLCGSSPPCIEGLCAAVACGGRVSVLRYDAAAGRVRAARGVGCGRARDLLLAPRALLLAAERPLRLPLPAGALEAFAQDDPLVAAAARQHSPPKAILLIKEEPMEILICYAECGVFLDDSGRRTRSEEARWGAAVRAAEYVAPFLYLASAARLSVLHVGDDAYRPPPCTCPHDAASLASTTSDYSPRTFHLKLDDPVLLGTAPTGVIVASRTGDGRRVSLVEGLAAFRSVGASVESLETIADSKGSSADLAQSPSPPELSPPRAHDASQESVEAATGFLADIRKRARQLRAKQRKERTPDDVIKEILTAEVGLKRSSGGGRRSPATGSEFDSDSTESEDKTDSKGTSDLCAEMFTRQVRFQ